MYCEQDVVYRYDGSWQGGFCAAFMRVCTTRPSLCDPSLGRALHDPVP